MGRLPRIASDDRLVELLREGDVGAFDALFERYQRPILSFCRHMLGSHEEAEDAVQHSFLAAYKGIVGSDRAILLRPWLYTIARNHCLSQLRARRQQASLDDVEPSVEGLAAEVQRRSDLRDMLRDLARLPDDQRAALVLAELGDLSHDEIAEVVGCPKGKVKALVFQARSSLSASRQARDTSCADIREQLSSLSGGALRRTALRRHLRDCEGCREFRNEVKHQRQAMAVLLPVVPSAGLKASVLSGVGVTGTVTAGAVAGGSGGGLAAILANAGVAKLTVAAVVAVSGVAAVKAVEESLSTTAPQQVSPAPKSSPAATREALTGATNPASSPTFEPTRAGGAHAPGKQTGGVANGKNPKGERGRSETSPGRTKKAPGRAGTSPGRAGTTPGQSGTAPGKAKARPETGSRKGGRSESSPGDAKTPDTSGGGSGGQSTGGGGGSSGGGSGSTQGTGGSSETAPLRGRPDGVVQDVTAALPKAK